MKKIWIFLIILIFCFSGCMAENEAQMDFESMMTAFKTADKTKINKYYDISKISDFLGEEFEEEIFTTLKKMDYRIISVEESEKNVKLKVEIETVDFSEIVKDYLVRVDKYINSKEYKQNVKLMLDEEYDRKMKAIMQEAIDACDARLEKTVDVIMVQTDEKIYKISSNSDSFLEALFENLGNSVEAFT